jgi:hypothetical protein
MTLAHDLIIEQFSPVDRQTPLATWYAQGHSDGLGDRLLMFDNTSAPSWEILRFRPALANDERFEAALHGRMEQLASFRHPAFPLVRPIKELGHEDGLAVVSTYASGARLSVALKKPRSAAFAMRFVRQLVPALTALQEHGAGIAHGALDADRIVVTAQGRLMIREHMVGAALGSLELPSTRLWADFGILASPANATAPTLDGRSDIVQVGLVALSLMAGRRIGPDEYPDRIEALLDDFAVQTDRHLPGIFQPLRSWLERALQLDGALFDSARAANDALAELRDETQSPDEYLLSLGSNLPHASQMGDDWEDAAGWRQPRRAPRLIAPRRVEAVEDAPLLPPVFAADLPAVADERSKVRVDLLPAWQRLPIAIRWVAGAIAILAVGEALFIGRLLYARATTGATTATVALQSPRPVTSAAADDQAGGPAPPQTLVAPPARPVPVPPVAVPSQSVRGGPNIQTPSGQKPPTVRAADTTQALAGSPRTGGFRLSSTVEVHVLEGDQVLGSSADGPIVAAAGQHEFEFVNSAIGYRERRVVVVRPGQITPITIGVPNGTLNINAVPWAAVWMDGASLGETPLGNLSVVPGEHEIVFRHPQLGERREKTLVRSNATTRVSVNLTGR